MLSFHQVSAILAVGLCVNICAAFYMGGHSSSNQRMALCRNPNKPCRLRVNMMNHDGSDTSSVSSETCSCGFSLQCGNDWNVPELVITRKVISTSYNISLQMMFCRPVEPKNVCGDGEIALIVTGSLAMPQDIVSYNCRCEDRQPLVLHERTIGEDHMVYHTYICANSQPLCARTAPCMTISPYSTSYDCKCGPGFHCRTISSTLWQDEVKYGYCTP